jgi:hypothetical protein
MEAGCGAIETPATSTACRPSDSITARQGIAKRAGSVADGWRMQGVS